MVAHSVETRNPSRLSWSARAALVEELVRLNRSYCADDGTEPLWLQLSRRRKIHEQIVEIEARLAADAERARFAWWERAR